MRCAGWRNNPNGALAVPCSRSAVSGTNRCLVHPKGRFVPQREYISYKDMTDEEVRARLEEPKSKSTCDMVWPSRVSKYHFCLLDSQHPERHLCECGVKL